MWDEKQFFEDFAKESDRVKPDREFVEDLKKLNSESTIIELKRKKNTRTVFRLASIAAAVVVMLAVGIGVYTISSHDSDKPDDGEKITVPIHAGQEQTTADTEKPEINIESICGFIEDSDILILDSNGNEISQADRNDLESMFKHASETDSITGLFGDNTEYIIKTEEDIVIRIYFDEYILVNGSYMYHVR